ncbi:MAG: 3-oxoacyl-ACP reductase FabG [Provencibacterium sp.]|jgi:3-oxoacyl-[acyl-carrier protein] reductase|nr:3-oxoacyl-ACP reductase FabG [Provencibacterium sp.]
MRLVVFITGASRGIGRAAARLFAREGWRVAAGSLRHREEAEDLCRALREEGCDACAVCGDVADREAVNRMFDEAERRLGPVDALVNNAGFAMQKLFQDTSPQEWERMLAVTLTGAYHCCQRALPGMLARKRGSIVNVSSIWGLTGASCEAAYSAAKAGLIGLTKGLAKELGPSGIRVNCIAPGVTATDMCAGLGEETLAALGEETPLGRIGTPEEAAEAILFLASPRASFITGQVLSPNGGLVI